MVVCSEILLTLCKYVLNRFFIKLGAFTLLRISYGELEEFYVLKYTYGALVQAQII
jgi:hypothetical protein